MDILKVLSTFRTNCGRRWIATLVVTLTVEMTGSGRAEDMQLQSKWDKNILNVELSDVQIKSNSMPAAWREITSKYLLRANAYIDVLLDSELGQFAFSRKTTTGKELIEAFVSAFPAYSYTQDVATGVIWLHPKRLKYENILDQKLRINHPAYQVRLIKDVCGPLCGFLSPEVTASPGNFSPGSTAECFVDLPAGVYSIRDILNFCCLANPTTAFAVVPSWGEKHMLTVRGLLYLNPLAPPRATAVSFWTIEIGKPTNSTPSVDEVASAMADANPRRRWAAQAYVNANTWLYSEQQLADSSHGAENAVWTAFGWEAARLRGMESQFLLKNRIGGGDKIAHLKDPSLALLSWLELIREKQDTSILDSVIGSHNFSEAEIASILPDIYRMAHESKLVQDKLKTMTLGVPEISPKALEESQSTPLFSVASSKRSNLP
jgi:hypothetical protein